MGIRYFQGIEDPCINVKNMEDLREVIDLIHTQLLENCGENSEAIRITSKWLDELFVDKHETEFQLNFRPVRAEKPFKDEIGDILHGEDFIYGKFEESDKGRIIPLMFYNFCNTWKSLKMFQVDASELQRAMEYRCPFSNNTYYMFLPIGLIVQDVSIYKVGYLENGFDFIFDLEWNQNRLDWSRPNDIESSLLGHGYTDGTLPTDGSGTWKLVKVKLSNGDFLLGRLWIWYNK